MRTSTLMSTVAAALLAATSIVSAQNEPKQDPKAAPKVEMKGGAGQTQAKEPAKDAAKDSAKPGANQTGSAVNLSAAQKTEIRNTVLQSRTAPKVVNPAFSISVGTTVPRTVQLVAVPATLFNINTAWRDHRYFIVGERIVIVDSNFRIVAVLAV